MARIPITTQHTTTATTPAVSVCSAERYTDQAMSHTVVLQTTNRSVNKALSINAHDLDATIAMLRSARNILHHKGIPTTPSTTPVSTTPPDPTYPGDHQPARPAPQDNRPTCTLCGKRLPHCYCELPTPTA